MLHGLELPKDPNLLVGFDTSDDAAVYRLSSELVILSTADFITPPVNDPYWFGQIAASNALSDIYAMGGRPIMALSLVMFPSKKLDTGILKEILHGGADKVTEAGACLAGGHSVDDNEPKYGLAVTGTAHPDLIFTNSGAKPGDAILLTKPLGTGVLFNASRAKALPYRELEAILPKVAELNQRAAQMAAAFDIHACTDITGFGILGHLLEVAKGSKVQIELEFDRLPLYPNAAAMYRKGITTGSNHANRKLAEGFWEPSRSRTKTEEEILFDPQTSGGLSFFLPEPQVEAFHKELADSGVQAAQIGRVTESRNPHIKVI